MSRGNRIGLVALAVVVLVGAFLLAKGSGGDDKDSGQTTIAIVGGKPEGGIKKITVDKGDPVRFKVDSDVSDEIHVHGYDFHKDVVAGKSVAFDFPAKIDGKFVVELEAKGEQIAELTVNP